MTDANSYSYIKELRSRLLVCLLVISLVFAGLCLFARDLYALLALPLLQLLPEGGSLLATSVVAPFLVPLKLVFYLTLLLVMPYLLYHVWSFVAPALYPKEKRLLWPLLFSSTLLFYLGTAFAYFVVLPLVFAFFYQLTPVGVEFRPDIGQYLDFTWKLFMAFGLAFEVPVATFLLVQSGMVSISALKSARPYLIVLAFVLGMVLTPPDVISQCLLAVPIWLLFELGLAIAGWYPCTKQRAYSKEKSS